MTRTALGDRTNFINSPVGKLGKEVLHATPQRQTFASYSPSPASYQHDPYALTPSPVPVHMGHSPMPVPTPEQPYPAEPTYYDYPQQDTLPPPPQLLPAPSSPASPTQQHYPQTWQVQDGQTGTVPSSTYYQPEPPVEVNGVAVIKFRFGREDEYSTTFAVKAGDHVLVGGDRGYDMGVVVGFAATKEVRDKKAVRLATEGEVNSFVNEIPAKERQVVREAAEIIRSSGIRMEITDAEFQFDMAKLTLYYTSPTARTDWRPALNDLFRKFQCRIWFRKSTRE